MKINFKNPQTGKPSTVVIADWWIDTFDRSQEIARFRNESVSDLVDRVAYIYFVGGFPDSFPQFRTFTQAVEYCLSVYIRSALGASPPGSELSASVPKRSDDNLPLPLD